MTIRTKAKLYETLGELLYAVAKADGIVQNEEKAALTDLLKGHEWAKEIQWSFDYEASKNAEPEDLYNKVISYCHSLGPSPEYKEFIRSMQAIAEAANGVDRRESRMIHSFSKDLVERFLRDLEKLKNRKG